MLEHTDIKLILFILVVFTAIVVTYLVFQNITFDNMLAGGIIASLGMRRGGSRGRGSGRGSSHNRGSIRPQVSGGGGNWKPRYAKPKAAEKKMKGSEYSALLRENPAYAPYFAAAEKHLVLSDNTTDYMPSELVEKRAIDPIITYDDIETVCRSWGLPAGVPYDKSIPIGEQVHNGQRKLFLNELFAASLINDNGVVVYAGAAPCNKVLLLSTLFPNLTFILIDPAAFVIYTEWVGVRKNHYESPDSRIVYWKANERSPDITVDTLVGRMERAKVPPIPMKTLIDSVNRRQYKIYIIEDFCTQELCKQLSEIALPIHFWSDIRTEFNNRRPTDIDILWNSAQQLTWIADLKATTYMLKFRTPYYDVNMDELLAAMKDPVIEPYISRAIDLGYDLVATYQSIDESLMNEALEASSPHALPQNAGRVFKYLDGDIYIQPWAREQSGETRLCGSGLTHRDYSIIEYENRFALFNNFLRTQVRVKAPIPITLGMRGLGANDHADFALELYIWDKYNASVMRQMSDDESDSASVAASAAQSSSPPVISFDQPTTPTFVPQRPSSLPNIENLIKNLCVITNRDLSGH